MSTSLATPGQEAAGVIASAVLACPGVARLESGGGVQVATYLPGRRVDGIRITDDRVTVNVVARLGVPLPGLAARVRSAVTPFAAGLPVDVRIADVDIPAPAGS